MVKGLEQSANDLHMVQLMPLPPHHLASLNREYFWCLFVLEKRPIKQVSVSLVDFISFCFVCLVVFVVNKSCSVVYQGIKSCSHMFGRNGFKRLMEFLIGQSNAAAGTDQV